MGGLESLERDRERRGEEKFRRDYLRMSRELDKDKLNFLVGKMVRVGLNANSYLHDSTVGYYISEEEARGIQVEEVVGYLRKYRMEPHPGPSPTGRDFLNPHGNNILINPFKSYNFNRSEERIIGDIMVHAEFVSSLSSIVEESNKLNG